MPKGPSGAIITIMRRLAIRAAFAAFAAACLGVSFAAAPALAQPAAQPGEEAPQPNETRAEKLDRLYGELQAATGKDAEKIVEQIQTVWAKSGSDSMDFLLMRAKKAIAEEAYAKARIHLAALTRLAPDFAEAWNASATLRFLTQDYAEAVVEIERTLALEPRHFSALTGLALILEHTGRKEAAMKAWRQVQALYPDFPKAKEAIERLSPEVDGRDL